APGSTRTARPPTLGGPVSASFELSPLFDPILERVGFPLDHAYIERVYCSVLGPRSVGLLRRAGELFAEHPGGVTVDLADLSRSLGLGGASWRRRRRPEFAGGSHHGSHGPVSPGLLDERGPLGIHPKVPALAKHQVARLAEP